MGKQFAGSQDKPKGPISDLLVFFSQMVFGRVKNFAQEDLIMYFLFY